MIKEMPKAGVDPWTKHDKLAGWSEVSHAGIDT